MSEGITHSAIVDDCARLARSESGICPAFRTVLGEHLEIARLGGVTRHGDRHNPDLLERYREQWPLADRPDAVPMKLAFVLGWLSHRAADRQMKRIFRSLDPDCPRRPPTDCSIYHDVAVLRHVYGAGETDLWGMQSFAADGRERQEARLRAEALLASVWQRTLLRMHTFIPDDSEPDAWLDRVVEQHQRLYVDLRRYAAALTDPDPELVRRFLVEPNFYAPADPIIVLARSLQKGTPPPAVSLAAALEQARDQSLYARMLRRAYLYTQAASEFFERRIDRDELARRLHIGVPELAEV